MGRSVFDPPIDEDSIHYVARESAAVRATVRRRPTMAGRTTLSLAAGVTRSEGFVYVFSEWDASRKGLLVKPAAGGRSGSEPTGDD